MNENIIWSMKKLLSGLSHVEAKKITNIALRDCDEVSGKVEPICDDVLKRLANLLNTHSDSELAKALGVAKNTVSSWRTRNKIPYEKVVELSAKENISLDTLIFGEFGTVKAPVIVTELPLTDENLIDDDGLACEQLEALDLEPSRSLYNKVRAAFVLNNSSLGAWCTANNVMPQNVTACLVGAWNGPKAIELRNSLIIASSLSARPELMRWEDEK